MFTECVTPLPRSVHGRWSGHSRGSWERRHHRHRTWGPCALNPLPSPTEDAIVVSAPCGGSVRQTASPKCCPQQKCRRPLGELAASDDADALHSDRRRRTEWGHQELSLAENWPCAQAPCGPRHGFSPSLRPASSSPPLWPHYSCVLTVAFSHPEFEPDIRRWSSWAAGAKLG